MKERLKKALAVNRSLKKQILIFSVLPVIVVSCIATYVSVSNIISRGESRVETYREVLLADRKVMLKDYTTLAVLAIESLPQKQALETIRNLRYGKNGYYWINDFNNFMISHPDPRLQGSDQSGLKDPNGIYILQEITKVAREHGEGFIAYQWKTPNNEKLQPKLSYGKAIKKWGWIVGTGLYINDIDEIVAKEKEKTRGEISSLITKAVLVSAGLSLAVILLVTYFANRLVNKPLGLITSAIKNYNNDLTIEIPITSENEIGDLAKSFNLLTASLRDIIKNVSAAVQGINSYASEVSVSVEQQATVTLEQSAAVSEITSTMEELSTSSTQIAEHSKSVVDIATRTWENTKKGASAVDTVITKMNEIHGDNENSIREIVDLGRKSKEISKVMEIINTVADQTKLIAFNAALEASSAGEAGRRFGVVAVEIRRLADSVMESTGEIETKVNEIQEAINRLVIASEKGSKGIQEGMTYSNQTAMMLLELVDDAQATQEAATQISLSTQQQKTASNQVVTVLREIVAGSSQTSDAIRQISSISSRLTTLSDDLKGQVDKFKII
jgi:methyl-accepting chemotaxis protein